MQYRNHSVNALLSKVEKDPAWDCFLTGSPLGHFQQSSMWAQIKKLEGWQTIRLLLKSDGQVVGGVQILWRHAAHLGRIGYVSKGPVIATQDAVLAEYAVRQMQRIAIDSAIRALIVQPPDSCSVLPPILRRAPFSPNHLMHVTDANLVVDLTRGFDHVRQRMRRATRNEISQAGRRGVTVREGGMADVGTFFRLMLATCTRQGSTTPNPARQEVVDEMWRILSSRRHIRITFAEFDGETLAGLLCIPFGKRVTFWKKGWSSRHGSKRPNQFLYHEAMQWASANGYESCDFASMDSETATAILKGEQIPESARDSRDFFNLGFGGEPALLPQARVFVPNPVLRLAYARLWPQMRKPAGCRCRPRR